MCSHNWEAFKYLQEQFHDRVNIHEQARRKMCEIIDFISMQIYVKHLA